MSTPQLPSDVRATAERAVRLIHERLPGYLDGMYLHGSLCWGEYFDDSDIDFVATTTRRPNETDIAKLQQIHRDLPDHFDGFYLPTTQLAEDPSVLPVHPGVLHGKFTVAHHCDANQVTWQELAERGITVHGPDAGELDIFTSDTVLELNTRTNLEGYWLPRLQGLVDTPDAGIAPREAAWSVLGVLRLHHALIQHAITSKSGAGRWGLEAMDERHRPVIEHALAWREEGRDDGAFADDAARQSATVDLMSDVLGQHDLHPTDTP